MNGDGKPARRLDRILLRNRIATVLVAILIPALVAYLFLQTPERIGTFRAKVLSQSLIGSDTAARVALDLELEDGGRHVLAVSPVAGIKPGDGICVALLRNPVFGRDRLMHIPNHNCDLD